MGISEYKVSPFVCLVFFCFALFCFCLFFFCNMKDLKIGSLWYSNAPRVSLSTGHQTAGTKSWEQDWFVTLVITESLIPAF